MQGTITQSEEGTILSKSYTLFLTDSSLDEKEPLLSQTSLCSYEDDFSNSHRSLHERSNSTLPTTVLKTADQYVPPQFLGPLLVMLAAVAFATNAFLIRVAESVYKFPSLPASFLIFLTTTIISALYSTMFVPRSTIKKSLDSNSRIGLLILRGVAGALASAACYKSYDYLPVGDAVAIYNVCPALTVVVAFFILKEKVGLKSVISIILSLCGAALVAQPGSTSMSATDMTDRMAGSLYALGDAALSAFAYTLVRFLGGSIHFSLSVGVVGACGTIIVWLLGGGASFSMVTEYGWGFIVVIVAAVLLFVAQSLLDAGLQYCPAGKAMLLRTTEVPLAYFYGMLFLGETPTATRAFGSLLVVSAACVIALRPKCR